MPQINTTQRENSEVSEQEFMDDFIQDLDEFDNEPDQEVLDELDKEETQDEVINNNKITDDNDDNDEDESPSPVAILKANKRVSKITVNLLNNTIAFILSLIALSDDSSEFLVLKRDLKELETAIADMLPTDKTVMPPWLILMLVAVGTFSPNIGKAIAERKENKEIQELKEQKKLEKLERNKLELKVREMEIREREKNYNNKFNQKRKLLKMINKWSIAMLK